MDGNMPAIQTPTQGTTERIRDVAKLRVEGMSWAAIAQKYSYASENSACCMMTQQYPRLWRDEYEKARELYLDALESEAILTQRELMRPTREIKKADGTVEVLYREEGIRQSAAHSSLNHAAKLRAQKLEITLGAPKEYVIRPAEEAPELTDEEIKTAIAVPIMRKAVEMAEDDGDEDMDNGDG